MNELLSKVEKEIETRKISEPEVAKIISSIPPLTNRRIISGYASVAIVDREDQKISVLALKEAVKRFMSEEKYRPITVFHSDVLVGRALPKWTDPNTGKIHKTEVDNLGLKCVVEVRDDVEIANKVWDEIIKGNLKSFSVAGTAKKKHDAMEGGKIYQEIDELDLLEITICLPENEKIWTKNGLKEIKNVTVKDFVLSHKGKWRKIIKITNRFVDEELIKITTENGVLIATQEHPIRTLIYEGQHKGTHYDWVPIKNIKIDDLISYHQYIGDCPICKIPCFRGSHYLKNGQFCSQECRYKAPGNRKGRTIASGDLGAISQANKLRGINNKQTSIEKKVFNILEKLYKGQWQFAGDGKFNIEGKFPDFWNGDHKIIEVYGSYWHTKKDELERIRYFNKRGYDCLVLWDTQIKNKEKVEELIKEFCENKLSKIIKIEKMHYEGLVYNLAVDEDESYTTEFAVVHNCATPVNSLAQFNVLYDPNEIKI